MTIQLRRIAPHDNQPLADLIVRISSEYKPYRVCYPPDHPSLKDLYGFYQQPGAAYWVFEDTDAGLLLGGCGFAPLAGSFPEEHICEMQKLYFAPEARGLGLARQLIQLIFSQASRAGYREIYLETAPFMTKAVKLYESFGFQILPNRKGNTGNEPEISLAMSYSLQLTPEVFTSVA